MTPPIKRKADAPSRSVTEVGPGDYVKIGSRWERIESNSAAGAERTPRSWTVHTDRGARGMWSINRYAITQTPQFKTVYPDGWFNRSKTAKQHAYQVTDEHVFDQYGNQVYYTADGRKRMANHEVALCGVAGVPGGDFDYTEPNIIRCSRCIRKANAIRAETSS